jgi:hypothetical protein
MNASLLISSIEKHQGRIVDLFSTLSAKDVGSLSIYPGNECVEFVAYDHDYNYIGEFDADRDDVERFLITGGNPFCGAN